MFVKISRSNLCRRFSSIFICHNHR